jgi:hypothetical protein
MAKRTFLLVLVLLCTSLTTVLAASSQFENQFHREMVGKPCTTSDGRPGVWRIVCLVHKPPIKPRGSHLSRRLSAQLQRQRSMSSKACRSHAEGFKGRVQSLRQGIPRAGFEVFLQRLLRRAAAHSASHTLYHRCREPTRSGSHALDRVPN